ncbi:MAG: hypothetical protein A2X08_16615 [Bacteroidetes bacterium GWA2_32_17]|nr:MAG: hypothetical protein A2X08_16615 [Bacteroidetes bacterium GWA2_32_17]
MKTKNFLVITVVLLVATVVSLAIYFNSGSTSAKVSDSSLFSEYISAYTSGMISKKSSISVKLTETTASQIKKDGIDLNDIFDFSPSISGKAIWVDEQTIEFKPDEDLKSATHYIIDFKLGKLLQVEDEYKTFTFDFFTIKQNFDVSVDETRTIDKSTYKLQKTSGTIILADNEPIENIQKILKAYKDDSPVKIKITAAGENKYSFEIDSVERTNAASTLKIKWDGNPIDVENKGEISVQIPPLDQFLYMSYKIYDFPEQCLQLQFSDPIDENQLLNGLITISNEEDLRFTIDDNLIKIYPSKQLKGEYNLIISEGIQNTNGKKLSESQNFTIIFEDLKPQVRLIGKGVILPHSQDGLVLPFEAVNLKAVDVRIIKIYENNITQFLQINELEGNSELKRVGKIVYQGTVQLDQTPNTTLSKWNRFTLDLNKLMAAEPGAIYRVSIGFRKQHSVYPCSGEDETESNTTTQEQNEKGIESSFEYFDDQYEYSYWNYYEDGYYENYWENRDNPCKKSYYNTQKSVSQNIIASDIGVIAKKGNDGSLSVFVANILSAKPMNNVEVEVYDYPQQVLAKGVTDGNGRVTFAKLEKPYLIIAKNGKQRGYLKLTDGTSLSLSAFEVSGTSVIDGLKGFIYGERGVWRPGDSLYLTFILEENGEIVPNNVPVVFEFKNPDNQLIKRIVQKKNTSGFYQYNIKTDESSVTGNYTAIVIVGAATFDKKIKIETIKPNRLKIKFDFGLKKLVKNQDISGDMEVKWLHGAIAKNLKTSVELTMSPITTKFDKYQDFVFDDPTKKYSPSLETVFEGILDDNGKTKVNAKIDAGEMASGFLKATFLTKVFEKGGDFSIDQFSIPYYPYSSFVGLKMPKGDKTRGMLLTDTTHQIEMVIVDSDGKLVSNPHQVEMFFYKIEWKWWWDQSEEYLANYNGHSYIQPLKHETISSAGGKVKWNVKVKYPDWGRYIVIAKDLTSGHSTGKVVYIDWPGWAGREAKDHSGAATQLTFTADKDKYLVGDKVNLTIPGSEGSRALVCIENGTKLIQSYWVETSNKLNQFTIDATAEMTPNIYVNITLLQPHSQTANDLPIRMYGILPISVENPATHLYPIIEMPNKLRAETTVEIKIKEKNSQDMTYTLAIVDEGLLDLTRFKTPDPWENFFAKEALGVTTWDLYDLVIGSYGGKLERILSIGGDEEGKSGGSKKANRFKPMVKFIGPFFLKGGKTDVQKIKLPNYIGSVRTMVIAGNNGAYGNAEKTTPVTKPLMVLATLPRVLGPGETLKLPVSVFAMENNVRNVTVNVKTNGLIKINGSTTKNITFKENGEEYIEFDITAIKTGIAKFEINATSDNEKAHYEVELDVRNPNPKVTDSKGEMIEPGNTVEIPYTPIGIEGTNKITLELSAIPPLNLEKRLKYLISYPHGCIEQTTSSVFPQLYLADLVDLTKDRTSEITNNIKSGIQRLMQFQTFNGGMSYWIGGQDVDEWGTSYAGHFLLEAQKKGYVVSDSFLKKWRKYQKTMASKWVNNGPTSQFVQSYRLYTLALSGNAEIGSMNRLKECKNLSSSAKWRLAAAYQIAGQTNIANKLIAGLSTDVPKYTELYYTYGSDIRDKSMILETLSLLGKRKEAFNLLKEVSTQIATNDWYSTQSTAYSLVAISKYLGDQKPTGQIKASYQIAGGTWNSVSTMKYILQSNIPVKTIDASSINIKNESKGVLYARIIMEGIPEVGNETDASSGLKITSVYRTLEGSFIEPATIEQGTDFYVQVTITNPTALEYKQMALSQIFPSGWEIINTRLLEIDNVVKSSIPTNQDIRDDRVYTYFDLKPAETKTFYVLLNASYTGNYYLPAINCEAMYDATINARMKGMWVNVAKP